ncbi:MAG: flavoprotein [Candidatus Heimdallarchaeaceae archaeon]
MTTRIAWAITGAGCWLTESFAVLGKLLKNDDIKIDLFFSEAGREVAQCYGVFKAPVPLKTSFIDKIREIPNFNEDIFMPNFVEKFQWLGVKDTRILKETLIEKSPEEEFDFDEAFRDVVFEIDEGSSFPTAATASNNKYDAIVISPATGNTIAKISQGIADNLITNLAIMGSKSESTPVIVIPTDFKEGISKSYLPIMLHSDTCKKCTECSSLWACKPGAIRRKRGKVQIHRLKCIGCLDCVRYCRHGIITFLEEIEVHVRPREAEATNLLRSQHGFIVLETPEEAYNYLCKNLKKS